MPTTITSAGITFNDATSLTSANIGTAQLVNGSVTAAKLGTTEQTQIAKAWVNFNGAGIASSATNAGSTQAISCNSGVTTGTWTAPSWNASEVGTIYKFTQINGVSGGTLGGVDVSTLGIQILSIAGGTTATFRFLSGTTTSSQSVTGTGSSASGFSYIGTGIRSSYNVSSITKNGTGDYTVNFATAMADANYSAAFMGGDSQTTNTGTWGSPYLTKTTSQFRFQTTTWSSSRILWDVDNSSVQIFGN